MDRALFERWSSLGGKLIQENIGGIPKCFPLLMDFRVELSPLETIATSFSRDAQARDAHTENSSLCDLSRHAALQFFALLLQCLFHGNHSSVKHYNLQSLHQWGTLLSMSLGLNSIYQHLFM